MRLKHRKWQAITTSPFLASPSPSPQVEMEEQKAAERELHKEAYVEDLNGPHLFHSMYADDTEAPKLAMMPDVGNLLAIYQEEFTKV